MPIFTADQLRDLGVRLFTAVGTPDDVAEQVAQSLVLSDLRGYGSHGIALAGEYVRRILEGRLDPRAQPTILAESATTALVDGCWGFGQIAARFAVDVLVRKALEMNVSAVGIRRCNHIGRLGEYAEQAAEQGVIAMVTLCAGGRGTTTTPHGGAGRRLGTNPFAFGLPAGEHSPVIVDFATTTVAAGRIAQARDRGETIPEGWILTRDGQPTTDPGDFFTGGMLLPMAGHKGFGLSLVADALGGALTGATQFAAGESARNCVFMWAVSLSAFQVAEEYRRLEDRSIEKVKSAPAAPGSDGVRVPGERSRETQEVRQREGIWLPEATWEIIKATAQRAGVREPLPQPVG